MRLNDGQIHLSSESEHIDFFIDSFMKLEHREEVPSFSQIFLNGKLISQSANRVEETGFADAHSEIIAVREAESALGSRYLNDCLLFTVLEPCTMCAGAIIHSRIRTVYYFTEQSRMPGISSLSLEYICSLNYFPRLVKISDERAQETLSRFFQRLRMEKLSSSQEKNTNTGSLL